MSRLRTSILRRGVKRFRMALRHLEDRQNASVERLRRGLHAMEGELARRGQPAADRQVAARAGRGNGAAVEPARASLPRAATSEAPVPRSSQAGGEEAGAAEDSPAAPSAEGTDGEPPRPQSPTSEAEPIWRLVPYLNGTSSKVVAVLDEESVIRYQSAPIKWLVGFKAEKLVGEPLRAFLCDGSQERAAEAVARMACGEEKFDSWKLEFQTASGESLWLEGMASNFLRDPRLGGILVYWRELVD